MTGFTDVDAPPTCLDCGHPIYMHCELDPPSNWRKPGDPVPCFAARADGDGGYTHCGCETVSRDYPVKKETK